jgi:PAS domain S-box-containing protein
MSLQKYHAKKTGTDVANPDNRAEDFQKHLEVLLEAFNKTPVGIFIISDQVVEEVNQRFCDLLGYDREELIGQEFRRIFTSGTDYDRIFSSGAGLIAAPIGHQANTCFQRKDKSSVDILLWYTPLSSAFSPTRFYGTAINIDEKKFSTDDLKQTFDLYQVVWEKSFDGLRLVDETGQIVIVNQALCNQIGKTREELIGQPLSVMYDQQDGPAILDATRRRMQNNQIVAHFERKATLWDGREVWFELSNSVIEPMPGHRMLLSIFRDITERRKAEKEIRLLAQATASVSECISITDLEDHLIYVNSAFERTYGYKSDEVIGKVISSLIRPVHNQSGKLIAILTDTLNGAGWRGELINKRKDGDEFPVYLSTSAILDEKGRAVALMGIARDITEQKRAEEALRESERKLATLVENLPGAAFRCLYDTDWTMLFISNGCRALTGYAPEDLIRNNKISYSQIIHPDDRQYVLEEISKSLQEKRRYQILYRIITAEKNEKWVLEQGIGVYDEDNHLIALEGFISDISERIRANAELQRSEARFRSVWEGSFDGMRLTDKDGKILAVNEAFCHQVRMKRSELEGARMGVIYPVDVRQAVEERYREQFRERRVKPLVEANIILWNAQSSWFEVSSSFIDNTNGETGLLCIFRDVTKRKKAEAEIAESARRFQWLYEYAPIAYHTLTPDGIIVNVNRQWCEILGYSKEMVLGKSIFDFVAAGEREAAIASFNEKRHSKKFFPGSNERHYITKSGDVRTFLITDYFSLDKDKNIISIQTTMADITERKLTEEALRQSETKFRKLVESSMDIIWQVDAAGRIIYISPNIEAVLNRPAGNLLGKMLVEVLPENARHDRRIKITEAFKQKRPIKNEELILHNQNNQAIILEVNAMPTYNGQGEVNGFIGTARDVTVQKAVENEQIKTQKLESLSVLAGGIAHDFNNLLVGILGNISLAKMKVKDADILRIIEQAERAAMRSRNLTQQLLTFAKGGAPVKEIFEIADFLRDTAEFALVGSSIPCTFKFAPGLPLIEADRGQITQVIQNLVINAIQAMPAGGALTITAEAVSIGTDSAIPVRAGNYIKISIKDTGIGIPEKLLSKIFDPYFTTKQHGSGLGLSVVYSIINKHNGHISVESVAGNGTTFTIYLPSVVSETKEVAEFDEAIPRGNGYILVMDDDELVCEVADGLISSLGYDVKCVHNGEEALTSYQEAQKSGRPFDAVIMDLTIIGGMGGKEAIVELKKIDPQVKAIVSSGYSTDPIMSDPQKYGFLGVIAKPYRLEDLSRILKINIG